VRQFRRFSVLDRYMVAQLAGPLIFGLSTYTLIIAATQLLAIGRLVGAEHAAIGAALAYFSWQVPEIIVSVIPGAALLGVLLTLQRLSSDSEFTAMRAAGISLVRSVAPFLVVGFILSLVTLALNEVLVPYANYQAADIRENFLSHSSPLAMGALTVSETMPGGGRQLTSAQGFDIHTDTLSRVTVIRYGSTGSPILLIYSDAARYTPPDWTFFNARNYEFGAHADQVIIGLMPVEHISIGRQPADLSKHSVNLSPDDMSRSQINSAMRSGALTASETHTYEAAYDEKLARPFASFVFALIAIPFGLRPARGGAGIGAGFGLSLIIVFAYFVLASVCSVLSTSYAASRFLSIVFSWLPNVIFTFGAMMLRRVRS